MTHPGHAWHLVISERGHVILQHLRVLSDDVSRRSVLLVPLQLVVGFDDIRQFVRQIVLQMVRGHQPSQTIINGRSFVLQLLLVIKIAILHHTAEFTISWNK